VKKKSRVRAYLVKSEDRRSHVTGTSRVVWVRAERGRARKGKRGEARREDQEGPAWGKNSSTSNTDASCVRMMNTSGLASKGLSESGMARFATGSSMWCSKGDGEMVSEAAWVTMGGAYHSGVHRPPRGAQTFLRTHASAMMGPAVCPSVPSR
jgi:hypothetical protein